MILYRTYRVEAIPMQSLIDKDRRGITGGVADGVLRALGQVMPL